MAVSGRGVGWGAKVFDGVVCGIGIDDGRSGGRGVRKKRWFLVLVLAQPQVKQLGSPRPLSAGVWRGAASGSLWAMEAMLLEQGLTSSGAHSVSSLQIHPCPPRQAGPIFY